MEKQTASSRVKTILHILFSIAFVLLFAAILLQWQCCESAEELVNQALFYIYILSNKAMDSK